MNWYKRSSDFFDFAPSNWNAVFKELKEKFKGMGLHKNPSNYEVQLEMKKKRMSTPDSGKVIIPS